MQTLLELVRATRSGLNRAQRKLIERLGKSKDVWQGALPEELSFWENALMEQGRHWNPESFRRRTDPQRELQKELKELIPASPGALVRILDVGAGPLTRIGKNWTGHELEITATDPLADAYSAILDKLGIRPPVRTIPGEGEKLSGQFPSGHFDLAYASNSLDHSRDPLRVIEQMLTVVKREHFVYLWHFANVGEAEGYAGLHQWNFDIKDGDFIVSDGRCGWGLAERLGKRVQLSCEEDYAFGSRVVIARVRKMC